MTTMYPRSTPCLQSATYFDCTALNPFIRPPPPRHCIDSYHHNQAIVDEPEIITNQGFSANTTSCLVYNFSVDIDAEIMGTQADRSPDCAEECAVCVNDDSPCQQCITGSPSAFVCDDADTRIFWDQVHLTTNFAAVLAEAVYECAQDTPDYDIAWVEVLCADA